MNMNPMMGNMNPMGMNNQLMTNFAMDDTSIKLKAIIEPYEKKITELEQIIKKKDFEILVLNQKLSKYKNNPININNNINMMNPMMMSNDMNRMNPMMMNNDMNMMNPMMMNNNMNWRDFYNNMSNNNNIDLPMGNMNNNMNSPKFNIFITYKGKQYNEMFNIDENTGKFFKRFCRKIGIKFKNCKFISNDKAIPSTLTFAEAGVVDKSQISVVITESNNHYDDDECDDDDGQCECEGTKYNIIFKHSNGFSINIPINGEHSLAALLKKYLTKIGISEEIAKKNLFFRYNNCKMNFDRTTKIKDFFRHFMVNITVFYIANLIGV